MSYRQRQCQVGTNWLLGSGLGLDAVVTSQLVPVPEDGITCFAWGQFLERTLWGITSHLSVFHLMEYTQRQTNKQPQITWICEGTVHTVIIRRLCVDGCVPVSRSLCAEVTGFILLRTHSNVSTHVSFSHSLNYCTPALISLDEYVLFRDFDQEVCWPHNLSKSACHNGEL